MEGFLESQQQVNKAITTQLQNITTELEQIKVHNKLLEKQIAQQAAESSQRTKGKLPSQPEPNPKGEVQAVALRSGKQLEE